MLQQKRVIALRWVGIQVAAVILVGLLFGIIQGFPIAGSVGLGGLVIILPTLFFALYFLRQSSAQEPKRIVSRFYRGEILKLGFTGLLFVLVFVWLPVSPLGFFAGLFSAQFAWWLAPYIGKI